MGPPCPRDRPSHRPPDVAPRVHDAVLRVPEGPGEQVVHAGHVRLHAEVLLPVRRDFLLPRRPHRSAVPVGRRSGHPRGGDRSRPRRIPRPVLLVPRGRLRTGPAQLRRVSPRRTPGQAEVARPAAGARHYGARPEVRRVRDRGCDRLRRRRAGPPGSGPGREGRALRADSARAVVIGLADPRRGGGPPRRPGPRRELPVRGSEETERQVQREGHRPAQVRDAGRDGPRDRCRGVVPPP